MLRLSGLVVGDTLSHVLGSQVVTPATFYAETWIAVDSAAANAISATTTLVNILACMIASPFFLSWLVRDRVRFPVWLVVETRGACGECCLNDVRAIGVCGEDVLASVNEHAENDVRAARETSAARTRSTGRFLFEERPATRTVGHLSEPPYAALYCCKGCVPQAGKLRDPRGALIAVIFVKLVPSAFTVRRLAP